MPRLALAGGFIALVAAGGVWWYLHTKTPEPPPVTVATHIEAPVSNPAVIGTSVEKRAIEAYTFGAGPVHLLFVGGVHGGYEWNSVALAYEAIDYLTKNPNTLPKNVTVSIIPNLNPDATYAVVPKTGKFTSADVPKGEFPEARFNANKVDLNRNFDCKWQPKSTWRSQEVSAGTAPFSEPEAQALRDYVTKSRPAAVVFWHSQSNAVYASECKEGILPGTVDLMNAYSKASGYKAVDTFDAYAVTGDAEGWLASQNIPAITVELSTHASTEWERNRKGLEAVLMLYANTASKSP